MEAGRKFYMNGGYIQYPAVPVYLIFKLFGTGIYGVVSYRVFGK